MGYRVCIPMTVHCPLYVPSHNDPLPTPPHPLFHQMDAVMEKYVRNARFCLICNYVSKIIPALQSRCTRFRFQPLPPSFVTGRVQQICDSEG